MFAIWIVFLISWMPMILTHKIDYFDKYPPEVYHIEGAIAMSNSAFNLIIYCVMNSTYRQAYKAIIVKCKM